MLLASGLVSAVLLSQWPYLHFPFTENEGMYACAAQQMVDFGSKLYRDVWDHKPPLLFAHAILIRWFFGISEISFHLYVVFVHCLNAFLLFGLTRKLNWDEKSGWLSSFFYASLLFPPLFQPWTLQADLLMQPFLILSFFPLFMEGSYFAFLCGCLWGLAFMTKQFALFFLPVYAAIWGFKKPWNWALFILGADLAVAAVALPFSLEGRMADFWGAVSGFDEIYLKNSWSLFFQGDFVRSRILSFHLALFVIYGLPLIGVTAWFLRRHNGDQTKRNFLAAWLLSALAACCVSGRFFSYYYLSLLPPVALILGSLFSTKFQGHKIWIVVYFSFFFSIALDLFGSRTFALSHAQYAFDRFIAAKEMGLYLKGIAKPDDGLIAWTNEPQIYFYSCLKMAVIRTPIINQAGGIPGEIERIEIKLLTNRSHFVLFSDFPQTLPVPEDLRTIVQEKYVKVKNIQKLDLFIYKTD